MGTSLNPSNWREGAVKVAHSAQLFLQFFIEPLAQAVREDSEIKGILMGETEYKISLFADDNFIHL